MVQQQGRRPAFLKARNALGQLLQERYGIADPDMPFTGFDASKLIATADKEARTIADDAVRRRRLALVSGARMALHAYGEAVPLGVPPYDLAPIVGSRHRAIRPPEPTVTPDHAPEPQAQPKPIGSPPLPHDGPTQDL
jgi:hypothetical protein